MTKTLRHTETFTKLFGPPVCQHLNKSQRIDRSFGLNHMQFWYEKILTQNGKGQAYK